MQAYEELLRDHVLGASGQLHRVKVPWSSFVANKTAGDISQFDGRQSAMQYTAALQQLRAKRTRGS